MSGPRDLGKATQLNHGSDQAGWALDPKWTIQPDARQLPN